MFTRYDSFSGAQLKHEFTKRFGPSTNKKMVVNRNQAKYKYRAILIKDDLDKGINPYIMNDHSNPSQLTVCNLLPQSLPLAEEKYSQSAVRVD